MIQPLVFVFALSVSPILSEKVLETAVTPTNYDLTMQFVKMYAEVAPTVFSGTVSITVTCCYPGSQPFNKIKLHSKKRYGIKILDAPEAIKVVNIPTYYRAHIILDVKKVTYDDSGDIIEIELKEQLLKGQTYQVTLNYDGEVDEKNGFVIWHDEENYIVATNSERQIAFPCFDEPSMRAYFKIQASVSHGEGTVIDNKLSSWSTFPPSQIVFVVTDLKLKSTAISFNNYMTATFLRNFDDSMPTLEDQTQCAIKKSIEFDFVGMNIPVTFLVVPDTALEMVSMKWGMANLSDKEYFEESKDKRMFNYYIRFTKAVFGGLISPSSWESAGYFAALAEFMARRLMSTSNVNQLMSTNALDNLLILTWERPSEDLDEIIERGLDSFQGETYNKNKGLLLFRMIYAFNTGLIDDVKSFVKKNQYKSVPIDTLWNSFTGGDFKDGSSWATHIKKYTDQRSYPIVTVSREPPKRSPKEEKGKEEQGKFYFRQEPFVGSFKERKLNEFKDQTGRCWNIPISFEAFNLEDKTRKGETSWNNWIKCDKTKYYKDTGMMSGDVAIFNTRCLGLYRVRYEDSVWPQVVTFIKTSRQLLDPSTRACILHDAFSLSWVGYQSYDKTFQLLPFLKTEDHSLVWSAFFYGATNLEEILQLSKETYPIFQQFVNSLLSSKFMTTYTVSNYFERMNEGNERNIDAVDAFFFHWACYIARNKDCTSQATEIVDKWIDINKQKKHILKTKGELKDYQSLLSTAYCTVMSEKPNYDENLQEKAEFLKKMLIKTKKNSAYREGYFEALRCMTDPGTIKSLLDWVCDKDDSVTTLRITQEDKQKVFLNLAKGKDSCQTTFTYFKDHVTDKIFPYHLSDEFMAKIVSILTPRISPAQVSEMETLIGSSPALKGKKVIEEAFDKGKDANSWRIKWLEENSQTIRDSIQNYLKNV